MLRARFLRWCHVMGCWPAFFWHRIVRGRPITCLHREVTQYKGWRAVRILCECGKEWT